MYARARYASAFLAAAAAVAAGAVISLAAGPAGATQSARTLRFYAFDINNGRQDPGFIPVPGSDPKVLSQGDELIINDQLTTTHRSGGGFPIVGRDSGVCTLTRIPEQHARQTLADCVVTAAVTNGTLTVQGIVQFKAGQPQPAALAVTGGTGHFAGASGTAAVSFTSKFKILIITLR